IKAGCTSRMTAPVRTSSTAPTSARARGYARESARAGAPDSVPVDERVAALDGIRAVAILWVIIHNVGETSAPIAGFLPRLWVLVSGIGWFRVHLFFAFSGYLITGILPRSRGSPGWIRAFYRRRVLRIVPLYYATLAVRFWVMPHIGALAAVARPGTAS